MNIKNCINKDLIRKIIANAKDKAVSAGRETKKAFLAMPAGDHKALAISGGTLCILALCTVLVLHSGAGLPGEKVITGAETPATAETAADGTMACSITVDGKTVVTLASKAEAQAVLDGVNAAYQTKGSEIISSAYAENVELVECASEGAQLTTQEDAVTMFLTGTKEPKTYTVQSGDSFWTIAHDNGMKVSELTAANPNANPDCLKIGSTLNLFEVKPYVHVTMTERLTATENIDYTVNYESTETLYKGETQVKVSGVYGQKEVTSEIVKENGKVVSTTEIASQVISEPQPQTVLKGTKSLSTLVGTGSFISPMGHLEISSAYGSRGGSRHTGVDLRNPKGTPIYVVDDGVVTHASYQGSYGNLVVVSHGNGIETYYAHCDTMSVSVGDVVRKGDQIATVGITGRATGYHLHFEVRKNGTPQNPMNYL